MKLTSRYWLAVTLAGALTFGNMAHVDADSVANELPLAPSDTIAPPEHIVEHQPEGWTVHGTVAGVVYTYRYDAPFVLVSNQENQSWKGIDLNNSWMVRCYVDGGVPNCTVTRVSVTGGPGKFVSFGFADGDEACFFSPVVYSTVDVLIDGSSGAQFTHARDCTDGEGAGLRRKLQASKDFHLLSDNGSVDVTNSTYGLEAALAMRDWILDQYRAGKLKAKTR